MIASTHFVSDVVQILKRVFQILFPLVGVDLSFKPLCGEVARPHLAPRTNVVFLLGGFG